MNIECPRCGLHAGFGATTNRYYIVCLTCNERFDSRGNAMSDDFQYTNEPDFRCSTCNWSERETRHLQTNEGLPTPWQRYRIHMFLDHNVPLPSRAEFDSGGVQVYGD